MPMKTSLKLAGISGSLRKGTKNLLPENVEIANFPIRNADVDFPHASHLSEMLLSVDNYSIPDGLNNVIDWASPGQNSPITGNYKFI